MKGPVIIDTGPLVASLFKRERHHVWAFEQFNLIKPPAITCEAVISEACFLIQRTGQSVDTLMQLLERGMITVQFNLHKELHTVSRLLKRYSSVPMSLADACLVRMAELYPTATVLTLDTDFRIYRKSGRLVIPTRMPG